VSWVFHCGAEGVYDRKSTAGAAGALTPDQCCPTIAATVAATCAAPAGDPPLTGPTFGTAGPMAPSQNLLRPVDDFPWSVQFLGRASPPMVAKHHQGGAPPIAGVVLQGAPELGEVAVGIMERTEVVVVPAGVGPLVGFPRTHERDAGWSDAWAPRPPVRPLPRFAP